MTSTVIASLATMSGKGFQLGGGGRPLTELKPATAAIFQHISKIWQDNASEGGYQITDVQQILASTKLMNEFEERRNELELAVRAHGAGKLETIQAWHAPSDENMEKVLQSGFHIAMPGAKLSFSVDPILAVKEGNNKTHRILLSRLQLGIDGRDSRQMHNKIIIENTRGVMPAFLVTYRVL